MLRPAGFIGHCNVRSSLNVGGEFSTSKKTPPVPENFGPSNADCPSDHVLICRMNPSHHGGDEQVFGAKQQILRGARGKTSILPMNGGSTKGNDGALLLLPLRLNS